VLAELAGSGEKVTPLAGDQSKVYLEGTIARCWNPVGKQPLMADGARSKSIPSVFSRNLVTFGAMAEDICYLNLRSSSNPDLGVPGI
jgi:hypothetical protein